eukprot:PhF_6_TR19605/c0_g1_i1/m.28604
MIPQQLPVSMSPNNTGNSKRRNGGGSAFNAVVTNTNSSPPPAGEAPSTLPPIVLKCPECSFMCVSNNQMCRHIFMTYHCMVKCAECDMRLLIWTYCPGVVKMLHRAKKDGLMSLITSIETPEKHASRTHHHGTKGVVWTKEDFIAPGTPEDYGLTSLVRCGSVPTFVGSKFQCPVCSRIISTWTQMTKHLDATNHSLARCAQCDLPLKCYGTNQPPKHERLTGHRGIVGYFRVKEDYVYSDEAGQRTGKHFQVACPDCGVTYFHTALLAHHMLQADHAVELARTAPPPQCAECPFTGSVAELEAHQKESSHHGWVPDTTSDLAQRCSQALFGSSEVGDRLGARKERIVPAGSKVMYQCPECVAIFSSWTKMEKHIFYTKHSLPKCAQCGVYLRPRGWNSPEDHTAITGHQGLAGEVRKKFEYEVTVDINDVELQELIDDPAGLPPKVTESQDETQLVFQCPVESCLHVCLSWVLLEKHFSEVRHGLVQCCACGQDVAPWKPNFAEEHRGLTGHDFEPSAEDPPRTTLEEYQVTITDEELLTYYGDRFKRCGECQQVLDANMMLSHMGSRRCQKNQDRRRQRQQVLEKVEQANSSATPKPMQPPALQPHMDLRPPPAPIGLNAMVMASQGGGMLAPGPVVPGADITGTFLSYLRLPVLSVPQQHDSLLTYASKNPTASQELLTAIQNYVQYSGDVPACALRALWVIEPLSRIMVSSFLQQAKSIVMAYYHVLPWTTRLSECISCIVNVSRMFDPVADRITIGVLQQYLNSKFVGNGQPQQQQQQQQQPHHHLVTQQQPAPTMMAAINPQAHLLSSLAVHGGQGSMGMGIGMPVGSFGIGAINPMMNMNVGVGGGMGMGIGGFQVPANGGFQVPSGGTFQLPGGFPMGATAMYPSQQNQIQQNGPHPIQQQYAFMPMP